MTAAADPIREGRWGIEQFVDGESVGSCLIWSGYTTEAEAIAANPPCGRSTYKPFDRHETRP